MVQSRIVDMGRWKRPGLAVLSYGFRPFFLLGAALAAISMPIWLIMLAHGIAPPGAFDAVAWHAHEMIFGFLAAIIAGFVLTAVPNWTGRLPLSGLPLAGLVALWLAGRVVMWSVASPLATLMVDCAFLTALVAAIWREIVVGRNLRNLPVAATLTLFAFANFLVHLGAWWPEAREYGERLALVVAALLMAMIGGRIVPSFTRNWMVRAGLEPLPRPFGQFDQAVLAVSVAAIGAWVLMPDAIVSGWMLIAAGLLHFTRLARWRSLHTAAEPMVLILHLGYSWLALSLLLLGVAALDPTIVGRSTALHALTAGAIGTMTLAVMTRASLGHTGNTIAAGRATLAIYVAVNAGALLRITAPYVPEHYLLLLAASGLLWSGAFALFVLSYGPLLLRPGAGRI